MIYIIISNIGMAIMMVVVYVRYSHLKISSKKELQELQKKIDQEELEIKEAENKFLTTTKSDTDKIEALLREVDTLRQEKESEVRLRLEAEKQIELALQRTEEIQKRMHDWRVIQDAVMKDSKDAIVKVGNDLYKKLNESYKTEVETNKNLIGRVSKNISEFFDKISTGKVEVDSAAPKAAHPHPTKKPEHKVEHHAAAPKTADGALKKILDDLVDTMKAGGHMVNKDYFLPSNFDEQKAKLFLCEVAFISSEKLYIFDFKASRYLEEYKQQRAKDGPAAEAALKQKLDKYFAYLSNPKYRESILKVLATTKAKFTSNQVVISLPSRVELQIMKEGRYYEKARKAGLEVMEIDDINNIVL